MPVTPMQVRHTGAAEYGQYFKVLIGGNPGAGKTKISATAPKPFYASAEGGLMSIADLNIPYVDIRSSDDLLSFKNSVDQSADVRAKMLGFEVETVVIDTIDEIQKILIRERLESKKQDAMQLQDWGWLGEQMQAIIRGFRNIDCNVIFTVHLKDTQDNESGKMWIEPGLQGAIAKQIPAYVDLALLLKASTVGDIEDGKAVQRQVRTLYTRPTHLYEWLKDRSGKLPAEIDVTFTDDFLRIQEMIFGGVHLQDAPVTSVAAPETLQAADDVQPQAEAPRPAQTEAKPAARPVKKAAKKAAPRAATPAPEVSVGTPVTSGDVSAQFPTKASGNAPEAPDAGLVCESCGASVTQEQADLSKIRFRVQMCRDCYRSKKAS